MSERDQMKGLILLATLNVCERSEGTPVELWANGLGKVFIRAYVESGYVFTEVPLLELIAELRAVSAAILREQGTFVGPVNAAQMLIKLDGFTTQDMSPFLKWDTKYRSWITTTILHT